MDHLQQAFITEAEDLLSDLEGVLLKFDVDLSNTESVEAIFRVMHSLKGSAGMFGFPHVSALTHDMETIFDSIREGHATISPEIIDITLQSVDHLKKIIRDKDLVNSSNSMLHRELLATINGITGSFKGSENKATLISREKHTYYMFCKLPPEIFRSGNNPLYLIDDVAGLGTSIVVADMNSVPLLDDLIPDHCYTTFEIILVTTRSIQEIEEEFLFVKESCELVIEKLSDDDLLSVNDFNAEMETIRQAGCTAGLKKIKALVSQVKTDPLKDVIAASTVKETQFASIRVASEKLDELMNLISELVTSQAGLSLLAQQNQIAELSNLSENMEKITRRLRDNAFNICLIPLQTLETRFQRLVRDLSKVLGKEIEFITEGGETELDRSIIEKISDPILHILRNCVDHGIESPDERLRTGKKKSGTILMKAFHSGTGVYIQIIDDGAGIDPEKIKAKAISKGIVGSDATLSKEQAIELVFAAGFSTAEKITDVSGRGVGMDIVKRNIESIHGEVTLDSTLHRGTTITIKLPLTLSVIDGMLVKIGSSDYILPLSSVDKCFEIRTEKLQSGLAQKVVLDGNLLPVFNLREAFNEHDEKPLHTQIIKIHYDEFPVCITVDSVIGEYQAVMRPLSSLYRSRDDFSGATILGDGSVALVMDTTKLIRSLALKA
jgi:two-component system, chemotaxis family, sensor kinase CheA